MLAELAAACIMLMYETKVTGNNKNMEAKQVFG